MLIDDIDVAVPVITPPAPPSCQPVRGDPVGDGKVLEHENRVYAVDAYTNTSPLGSPRLQCHGGENPAEVLGEVEVEGEAEETEQEFAAEDEPFLVEGTFLDSRYRILKILGHGNFSTTYLAEETPTEPEPPDMPPNVVAIKRLKKPYALIGENEFLLLGFLHEEERPRHIISPIASFFSETDHFHLVLEPLDSARPVSLPKCYCVSRRVHSNLACPLRHLSLAKILVQLLSGLLSLHSHNLIHADLTPANVLFLPSSNRIKLIDLGNAIQPNDREAYLNDFGVQSACYRAPEILLGSGPLSRVMDIWSAGVIAVELLFDGEVIGEGREGAELMRSGVDGREALVLRTVELVGSVREYAGGMYYMDMYDDISLEPVVFMPEKRGQDGPLIEKKGILRELLEDATEDVDLVGFLMDMMEVGVGRRKTVDGMLKHSWLISQLLDNWGNVLMGWIGGDRGGATDGVPDQSELVPDQLGLVPGEEGGFGDVRRSELVEDVPGCGGFLFFDGRQDEEDPDQFLEVGGHESIQNDSTDGLELDSSHTSPWEDISIPPPFERELHFDGLKSGQSIDRLEPDILPPLTKRSPPYHSPWEGASGPPPPRHRLLFGGVEWKKSGLGLGILQPAERPPSLHRSPWEYVSLSEHQLQFDEVKRELSSSPTFRFGEEDEINYLDSPGGGYIDNSVHETSLITNDSTTSITPGENVFPSLPCPPPLPTLSGDIATPEFYPLSPVAFVGGVEQVESASLSVKGEDAIENSGVWHRDLAADMVYIYIFVL